MIKKTISIVIFILCFENGYPQYTFQHIFKSQLHQVIGDIIETENGDLIFPILTDVPRETKIMKMDKQGVFVDSILIDTSPNTFWSVLKYTENIFFIAGCKNGNDNDTFRLLKYNYNFSLLKELSVPTYGTFYFSNFIPMFINNKGNIVADFISHKSDFDAQTCLMEINPECEIVRSKIFTNTNFASYTCSIIQKSKYYYFFVNGWLNNSDMMCNIYKIDTCFNSYGYINIFEPYGPLFDLNTTKWINDSVFLLTGYYTNGTYGATKVIKIKADTTLLQAFKVLEIKDNDSSIRIANYNNLDFIDVNNIYVGGWMYKKLPDDFQHVNTKFVLTKIDSALNIKWQRIYGGYGYWMLDVIKATQDGGCVMGGTYYGPTQTNEKDPFIFKVNSEGLVLWEYNLPMEFMSINVYPNPGSNQMIVNNPPLHTKIILYDIIGKLQKEQELDVNNTVNTEDLKAGIYFYQVIDNIGKVVAKGKWVKASQ